jgi:hypothetical protein
MKQMQFEASLKGEVVWLVDIGGYPHLFTATSIFRVLIALCIWRMYGFILQHSGFVFVRFLVQFANHDSYYIKAIRLTSVNFVGVKM